MSEPFTAVTEIEVVKNPDAPTPGHPQYVTVLVPAGSVVEATLTINGKAVATLGPWTATAKIAKSAVASLRLRVNDDCGVDRLAPVEVVEPVGLGE